MIPHPFVKLVNYHGVFASAFPLRQTVVPPPPDDARTHLDPHHPHAHHAPLRRQPDAASPLAPTKPKPKPRPRTLWAELLRRVYLVDALTCPHCGATRRLLAFVTDQSAIHRILDHLARTGRGPPDEASSPRDSSRDPGSGTAPRRGLSPGRNPRRAAVHGAVGAVAPLQPQGTRSEWSERGAGPQPP